MLRLIAVLTLAAGLTACAKPGSLSSAEKPDGFQPIFDGASLKGWRGYKTETPPAGWRAAGGELIRDGEGGDLMTVDQYADFELRLDWKISKNGNSGIMFHVRTGDDFPYLSGPEFQVLDNAGHADGKNPLTSAGSNYAVNPPVKDVTKPIGEWNDIRLIVRGTHVEHWMNGVKLLEYEFGSADWDQRVQASKFAKMPMYGREKRGYIALQDHGNLVTYRNIRIKVL